MSTEGSGNRQVIPPTMQAGIRRSAALTQNQWVDLWTGADCAAGAGSVKRNVRIYVLCFEMAVAQETIEIRIIADGEDETASQDAVAGTNYSFSTSDNPDSAISFTWTAASVTGSRAFFFEAKACQIMYRKTTAAGANNFSIKVVYATW